MCFGAFREVKICLKPHTTVGRNDRPQGWYGRLVLPSQLCITSKTRGVMLSPQQEQLYLPL